MAMQVKFKLKVSRATFALAVVLVNAANTYLVPLVGQAIPVAQDVSYVQGFLTVALNGVVVWLSTEQQQVPSNAAGSPG